MAVVALGSNLGDCAGALGSAAAALGRVGREVARSSLYDTAPVGPPQPRYLNAVMLLETALGPLELLEALLAVERQLGRVRTARWAPRTIDLDLVALDDLVVDLPGLTLPHPRAHLRAFVLAPLVEVAPEWTLPGRGRARELLASLEAAERAGVRRTELAL